MKRLALFVGSVSLLLVPLLTGQGAADPYGPIVIEGPLPSPYPPNDPLAMPNIPGGGRPVQNLKQPYVEEEFFYSGMVDVYNYTSNPAIRGEKAVWAHDVPYKTRILVRRPASAQAFNGTVVIEWMNSSAGYDSTPVWLPSAEYFARSGIVWIGVTTSGNQSIPFLRHGCVGSIPPPCGSRYASLQMSDNGQEYEMVSQLAAALKAGGNNRPLPTDFGPVLRVFHSGQSQQGGSIITYASEFHFPPNDGYFFMGASNARLIRGTSAEQCGRTGVPAFPDCVPLLSGKQARVRTDLPVPVYRGASETDVGFFGGWSTRQDDTDTSSFASFRLIEVAATAHNVVHKFDILPGVPFPSICLNQPYTMADGPIFGSHVWNAMWENMRRQIDEGVLPPYAPRIEVDPTTHVILRDEFLNARGGVRLPEIDVPTNSYFQPTNTGKPGCGTPGAPPPPACIDPSLVFIANLACLLSGSYTPLPQATLDMLYPNHGTYVNQIVQRTNDLVKARFLLEADAQLHRRAAAQTDIGK